MNKKVELRKGTAKENVLKADCALFAQMTVIAEARQVSMKEVFSHPLGSANLVSGSSWWLREENIEIFIAKELQNDAPVVENLLPQSACIIDGMAMFRKRLEKLQICCWPCSCVKAPAAPGSMLCKILPKDIDKECRKGEERSWDGQWIQKHLAWSSSLAVEVSV